MTSNSRIVVVAGFHRSLTSAVAQWLHKAGLPMGSYLMPPNPSNPDGHFEDMSLVSLHDQWLARHDTNWQYHDEVPLSMEYHSPLVERYIQRRNRIHGLTWGMKDPRQCLFLSRWDQALGCSGRYIILLRHWAGCIQSLHNRHAANLLLKDGPEKDNCAFWRQPTLAADMWIAYNRRLLKFIESSPKEKRIVITQRSILNGIPLINLVNQALDVNLNTNITTPIKTFLSHNTIDESIKEMLEDAKVESLNKLWEQLLSHAAVYIENESVAWESAAIPAQAKPLMAKAFTSAKSCSSCIATSPLPPLDWQALLVYARSYPQFRILPNELFQAIEREAPFDAKAWKDLALLLLGKGHILIAEKAILRAILCNQNLPYIRMLYAACRKAVLDEQEADYFYKQALSEAPNDPTVNVEVATFWMTLGWHADAENLLAKSLRVNSNEPSLIITLAHSLDQQGKTKQAISLLKKFSAKNLEIEKVQISLKYKMNPKAATLHYQRWIKCCENQRDIIDDVASLMSTVKNRAAQADLCQRMITYWLRHSVMTH